MIKEWMQEYQPKNQDEAQAALREIMQEVALAGLQRAGFFEKAAFYGDTALRIFHGLDRFSEDLDFSLLEVNPGFSLEPYFKGMMNEFEAIGMDVSIKTRNKKSGSNVESAFLKSETIWKELILEGVIVPSGLESLPKIKIKLEVDREPPAGFSTEEKLLLKPFSFYVKCYRLPDLFAGKMHALLFRSWQLRVKGRDWYDLEWYIKKGVPLHIGHFLSRARDSGNWKMSHISKAQILELLRNKIEAVSFDRIREDIIRFIPNASALDIWSPRYFKDLADKIKFE
ncbi:MAG TPA: nucleotidyl transferase AbiEii/AbiGii toxin family protein [Puia sp.]|nr:nucleotidyl transferase AbiEii/AbiGii toxin family protein [Puia sp.]